MAHHNGLKIIEEALQAQMRHKGDHIEEALAVLSALKEAVPDLRHLDGFDCSKAVELEAAKILNDFIGESHD